jgi:hypothetical protein
MSEKSPVIILPMRVDGAVNANAAGHAALRIAGTFYVFKCSQAKA